MPANKFEVRTFSVFALFSAASLVLFSIRPLDDWLLNFPIEAYLPFYSLLAFLLLGRRIGRTWRSLIFWTLYLFVIPLSRPPILENTFTFLWHFVPIFVVLFAAYYVPDSRNADTGAPLPRGIFWGLMLFACALKVYTVRNYGLAFGPIDIGTATIEGAQSILHGINPYTIPEKSGMQAFIHRQHCVYPPMMLLAYVPWMALFSAPPAVGLYVGNFVLDSLSLYFLYLLFSRFAERPMAQSLTLLAALSPVQLVNLYVRGTNDIVPFVCICIFLIAVIEERTSRANIAISFAVATKWFSAPLAALWGLLLLQAKRWRSAVALLLAGFAMVLVPALPFFWLSPREFLDDLTWEGRRPVDDWEIPLSLQRTLFGDYHPWLHSLIVALFLYAAFRSLRTQRGLPSWNWLFVRWSISLLVIFAISSNVFHHNYLGWFYSLLPLLFLPAKESSAKG
ncbi:MAG: DUF2029 domain-containing protein [Deltaproteobacteria bacterium]|nr:DUF2029 domain-containing protein [Deltaproteobacteria bacterium]